MATVILLTEDEAKVMRDIMERQASQGGAILVYPEQALAFEKKHGQSLEQLKDCGIPYEWGGDYDAVFDVLEVEEDEQSWCEEGLLNGIQAMEEENHGE